MLFCLKIQILNICKGLTALIFEGLLQYMASNYPRVFLESFLIISLLDYFSLLVYTICYPAASI